MLHVKLFEETYTANDFGRFVQNQLDAFDDVGIGFRNHMVTVEIIPENPGKYLLKCWRVSNPTEGELTAVSHTTAETYKHIGYDAMELLLPYYPEIKGEFPVHEFDIVLAWCPEDILTEWAETLTEASK